MMPVANNPLHTAGPESILPTAHAMPTERAIATSAASQPVTTPFRSRTRRAITTASARIEGNLDSLGINDQPDDWQVEEHAITGARPRQRLTGKRPHHGQHLRAVVLHTGWVQVRDVVATGVIPLDSIGKGQVKNRAADVLHFDDIRSHGSF